MGQKLDKNQMPPEVPIMVNEGGIYKIPVINTDIFPIADWLVYTPDPAYPNDRTKDFLNISETKLLAFGAANGFGSGGTPLPIPSAPTNGIVNDTANTFTVTPPTGYTSAQLETSINGGTTWTNNPSLNGAFNVGDVALAIGQVITRVKASSGVNQTGLGLANTTAFTASGGGTPTGDKLAGYTFFNNSMVAQISSDQLSINNVGDILFSGDNGDVRMRFSKKLQVGSKIAARYKGNENTLFGSKPEADEFGENAAAGLAANNLIWYLMFGDYADSPTPIPLNAWLIGEVMSDDSFSWNYTTDGTTMVPVSTPDARNGNIIGSFVIAHIFDYERIGNRMLNSFQFINLVDDGGGGGNPEPTFKRLTVDTGGLTGVTINDGTSDYTTNYRDYPTDSVVYLTFTKSGYSLSPSGGTYTMDVDKTATTVGTPIAAGDGNLAEMYAVMDAKWDNVISARDAQNINGTKATKGQAIHNFPARKGTRGMPYQGVSEPYLLVPYYDEQDGWLTNPVPFGWFKNQSGIWYGSAEDSGLSEERTWCASILFPDYQIYEGFLKTYGTPYLGTSNSRTSNDSPFNLSVRTTNDDVNNVIINNFAVNGIHHIIYRMKRHGLESENPGKIGVELWFDGVLLNPDLKKETFNTLKRIEVIGADTNCMTMGFVQLATAYRAMSTPDIMATFDALRTFYGTFNTTIPLPTATNIMVSRNGDIVTVNYTITPVGFIEDTSKTLIIWEHGTALQTMYQKPTINNLKTFNIKSIPDQVDGNPWRCSVFITSTSNKTLKLPAIWFGSL